MVARYLFYFSPFRDFNFVECWILAFSMEWGVVDTCRIVVTSLQIYFYLHQ